MRSLSLTETRAMMADMLRFMEDISAEMGGVAHVKVMGVDYIVVSEPAVTHL